MQDISLAVKVDKRQVKDLKTLIGQVEKQVGALNKVKVTLDTSPAKRNLDRLTEQLKQAETVANRFFGSNPIRKGLGAFSNSLRIAREELSAVRAGFNETTNGAERARSAVQLLAGEFKNLSSQGRAMAIGGADLFKEKGFENLESRLKPLKNLPNSLAGTEEALKEIRFLLNFATENSKEFKTLIEAENQALARQKKIRESMAFVTEVQRRATAPMPEDPFGTKVPLLPAAGQTSGTFEIVERNREIARIRGNSLQIEEKITQQRQKQAAAAGKTAQADKGQKGQRGKQLNEFLLGAGFPLLFGGGPGAVGGSILGGAIGAPMGAAFGGQIFGSAIGQTLENSLRLAVDIGNAVETLNLDALEESGIRVNSELEMQVQLLREAGEFRKAEEAIQEKVAEQTGAQGDAMQDVANAFNLLGRAAKEFLTVTSAFLGMLTAPIAAALAGIIKVVNEIIKQANILFSLVGKSIKKIAENEEVLKGVGDQLKNINGQFDEVNNKAANFVLETGRELNLLRDIVAKENEKVDGKRLEDKINNNLVSASVKRIKLTEKLKGEERKLNAIKVETNAADVDAAIANEREITRIKKQQVSNAASLKNRKLITAALEKADKAHKSIEESLQKQIDKQLDQVAFENEYAELIMSGSLPAAAQRALGLKQYLKDLDKQFKKELDVLDTQIAQLETQTVENAMTKEQIELLDELIEKRDKLEKKKKDAEDAAKKNQGPKSDAKRIEEEMVRVRGELNNLIDPVNQVIAGAQAIGDAFAESFKGLITGSMSAQEALANLFQRTADHFADMAAQMIAKAIQMKILGIALNFFGAAAGSAAQGSFAGVPNSTLDSVLPSTSSLADTAAATPLSFASGGYASGPTRALIGEGGQGEYVIPESKMRESMARYSRGARGSSVIPETGASGTSGEGGGVAVAAPIDVRYSIERINNIDYVTNDQFQQGLQQAAAQGAQRGEQNTLKRLQMSGSTRRRLGM